MKLTFVSLLCIKITAKVISKPFFRKYHQTFEVFKFHKLMRITSVALLK